MNMESIDTWGRIADKAITALKEQISRLQKERDELAAKRDIPPKILWRPVSDPPIEGERVIVSDGVQWEPGVMHKLQRASIGESVLWETGNIGKPKIWMPIPKLPVESDHGDNLLL